MKDNYDFVNVNRGNLFCLLNIDKINDIKHISKLKCEFGFDLSIDGNFEEDSTYTIYKEELNYDSSIDTEPLIGIILKYINKFEIITEYINREYNADGSYYITNYFTNVEYELDNTINSYNIQKFISHHIGDVVL